MHRNAWETTGHSKGSGWDFQTCPPPGPQHPPRPVCPPTAQICPRSLQLQPLEPSGAWRLQASCPRPQCEASPAPGEPSQAIAHQGANVQGGASAGPPQAGARRPQCPPEGVHSGSMGCASRGAASTRPQAPQSPGPGPAGRWNSCPRVALPLPPWKAPVLEPEPSPGGPRRLSQGRGGRAASSPR